MLDDALFGALLPVLRLEVEVQRVDLPIENSELVNDLALRIVTGEPHEETIVRRCQRLRRADRVIDGEGQLVTDRLEFFPQLLPLARRERLRRDLNDLLGLEN